MTYVMQSFLDLVFFVFDKPSNPIIFIPFCVIFICFSFGLVRKLSHI